jgi:hypothetical protein
VKPSFRRGETSIGALRFEEVNAAPIVVPSWLGEVSSGKATTVVSLYPAPLSEEDLEADDDEIAAARPSEPVYIPSPLPANDAFMNKTKGPTRDPSPLPPPMPVAVRLSEIPAYPKAPDTLIEELIPRENEHVAAALAEAVGSLMAARSKALADAENDMFELVKLVAERVVGRELNADPRLVVSLVHEGILALSSKDQITIRLGSFFADIAYEVETAVAEMGVDVTVRVEPQLGRYACLVESQWGKVDESVEARLRTMLHYLDASRSRAGQ